MAENNNLTELVRIAYRWRKTILTVTLIAAIGSAIIALMLPKYYKSKAIFYAYNLNALDPKTIISEDISDVFGGNSDMERMIQIGKSSGLANHIIKKFDLYKRYDIDTVDNLLKEYQVNAEFASNFEILKNDNGAIEIIVLDQDPQIAADIANEVLGWIDKVNKKSIVENNSKIYEILKSKLNTKHSELDLLSHSLHQIEKEKQEKNSSLTTQSMVELGKLERIDQGMAEKLAETAELKGKYEQISSLLTSDFSTVFIVEPASPAVIKAKPLRSLIVAAATFIAFVLTLISIIIVEFYRSNIRDILT